MFFNLITLSPVVFNTVCVGVNNGELNIIRRQHAHIKNNKLEVVYLIYYISLNPWRRGPPVLLITYSASVQCSTQ